MDLKQLQDSLVRKVNLLRQDNSDLKDQLDEAFKKLEEEKAKSRLNLQSAMNNYVLFCRSLGLSDQASTEDFYNFYYGLKAAGKQLQAMEIAIQALALINAVTQNGGTWKEIEYKEIEVIESSSSSSFSESLSSESRSSRSSESRSSNSSSSSSSSATF